MTQDEDVELARSGDMDAFNRLHHKYWDKLVKTLCRRTQDIDEAEDMAQEAFIRAYYAMDSYRGDSHFLTWLTSIGINNSNNHQRKLRRRVPQHDVEIDSVSIFDEDSPESYCEMEQTKDSINLAYYSMIPEFRDCLEMRLIDELSYDDIADDLGIPVGTVRSRISRGKRELKKQMQGE